MTTPTRKTRKHKPQRSKSLLIIPILLLAAALGFGITFFLLNRFLPTGTQTPTTQVEAEKNPNSIAIPGYEGLTLKANSKRQDLALKNPAQNTCYFVITLSLQDGTELWKSDYIEAGKASRPIVLNRELPAGNYPAVLKYECYRMDDVKTPLNGAETKLTLRVK